MKTFSRLLFPSLLIGKKIEDDLSDVLKWAYSLRDTDPAGAKISNEGGWQSHPCLREEGSGPLCELLTREVGEVIAEQMPLNPGYGLGIESAWVNISGDGAFNWEHDHPLCFYSGVLYLRAPEGCGDIRFMAGGLPSTAGVISDECRRMYNIYGSWTVTPRAGLLLLFPADLRHRVEVNRSGEDRVSVAFNLALDIG